MNFLFSSFPYEYDEPLYKDSSVNVCHSLTDTFMVKSVKQVPRRNNVPLLQRKYIPIPWHYSVHTTEGVYNSLSRDASETYRSLPWHVLFVFIDLASTLSSLTVP